MLENILAGVISGLITAGVLEVIKKTRVNRDDSRAKKESVRIQKPKQIQGKRTSGGVAKRLIISPFFGFLLGGFTAGILEGSGYETIELGSALANVLIAVWTIVVWLYLSMRKSKSSANA